MSVLPLLLFSIFINTGRTDAVLTSGVFVSIFTRAENACLCAGWLLQPAPRPARRGDRGPLPHRHGGQLPAQFSTMPFLFATLTTSATSPPATTTALAVHAGAHAHVHGAPSPGRTSGPSSAGECSPSEQTHG